MIAMALVPEKRGLTAPRAPLDNSDSSVCEALLTLGHIVDAEAAHGGRDLDYLTRRCPRVARDKVSICWNLNSIVSASCHQGHTATQNLVAPVQRKNRVHLPERPAPDSKTKTRAGRLETAISFFHLLFVSFLASPSFSPQLHILTVLSTSTDCAKLLRTSDLYLVYLRAPLLKGLKEPLIFGRCGRRPLRPSSAAAGCANLQDSSLEAIATDICSGRAGRGD